MSNEESHIIKSQEYQIALDDKSDAYTIQTGISTLQNTKVNTLLNTILSNYSSNSYIYMFDKIEIDLGTINKHNYENELLYKLEEALISYFNTNILKNGTLRNGKKLSFTSSKIEHLEHFLVRGYVQWNNTHQNGIATLCDELLQTQQDKVVNVLKKNAKKEIVRKRLIFQFPEKLRERMVMAVSKNDGQYILDHKKNIVKLQKKQKLVQANSLDFNNALWEILLAYIFVESHGYFHQKTFLKYTIQKIALKYNLTYSSLLRLIAKGVKYQDKTSSYSTSFKNIIIELEEGANSGTSVHLPSITYKENDTRFLWIQEMDSFLKSGHFKIQSHTISKDDFNRYLLYLLESKDSTALRYVNSWLANKEIRNRLVAFTNNKVLDVVTKKSNAFYINICEQFIEELKNNTGILTPQETELLVAINTIRSKLILSMPFDATHSEEKIITDFLHILLLEFTTKEATLYKLFEQVKIKLSKKYQKSIQQFLSKFYSDIGKKVLLQIVKDIKLFTVHNHSFLWNYWADRQWEHWSKKTGLHKKQLISQLNTIATAHKASGQLYAFLRNLESSYSAQHSTITNNRKNLFLKNSTYYVIQNGKFPWWKKDYTGIVFSKQVKLLLQSVDTKKELLQIMAAKPKNLLFTEHLEATVLLDLWLEFTDTSGKPSVVFLSKLISVLESYFVATQIISPLEVNTLQQDISALLFKNRTKKTENQLFKLLEKWLSNSKLIKSENLLVFFKHVMATHKSLHNSSSLQKKLIDTIKFTYLLTPNTEAPSKDFKNSFSYFLQNISSKKIDTSDIQKASVPFELHKINKQMPEKIDHWLKEERFREYILDELEANDLQTFILEKVNTNQQEYVNSIFSFFKTVHSLLTHKELKAVTATFYKLILLKLAHGGFAIWNHKEWSILLLHSFYSVLTKEKSHNLLFSIKNKEAISTKKDKRILDELFKAVTMKTALVSTKKTNTEKAYKKLGEKEAREFINPIFIKNAGLVILAPYIALLFEKCGLVNHGRFLNDKAKCRAVHLLAYAATGKIASEESELVLNKIICGIPIATPIEVSVQLTNKEKEIVQGLLTSITQQWKPLQETSIDGLRSSFLMREGRLAVEEKQYCVKVAQKSFDMLLDQIPWNINMIKLSWMDKLIQIEWR